MVLAIQRVSNGCPYFGRQILPAREPLHFFPPCAWDAFHRQLLQTNTPWSVKVGLSSIHQSRFIYRTPNQDDVGDNDEVVQYPTEIMPCFDRMHCVIEKRRRRC